jgi:hypothetical protein
MVCLMQYLLARPVATQSWEVISRKEEVAMKTTLRMLIAILAGSASAAYAAQGAEIEGAGVLAYLFIGFFALIVVTQLVPAMILFFGMVKGLFTRETKKDVSTVRID